MNENSLLEEPKDLFSFKSNECIICRVCHIYDGDTVHIVMNYKGEIIKIVCRLYGIDTPEMNGLDHDLAMISRNRLTQLITDIEIDLKDNTGSRSQQFINMIKNNKKIIKVKLLGRDKYGRELAIFYDDQGKSINNILIDEAFAKPYSSFT